MAFAQLRAEAKASREGVLRRHRADGGAVSDEEQDRKMVAKGVNKHERRLHPGEKETKLADGGKVGKRLDRYARGGRAKHKGSTVNVIVAGSPGGGQPQPVPVPVPRPVPVAAGVPPGGPPPGALPPRPMMPPPGGGGLGTGPMPPPGGMPMRARGGGVKMTAGALSGEGRLQKTRAGYLE